MSEDFHACRRTFAVTLSRLGASQIRYGASQFREPISVALASVGIGRVERHDDTNSKRAFGVHELHRAARGHDSLWRKTERVRRRGDGRREPGRLGWLHV